MDFLKIKIKEFLGSLNIVINYIITDILKRPRSFKIGVFSIFLVVSFLAVIQAGLSLTPIIFIKLAENQASDIDLMMTPIPVESDPSASNTSEDTVMIRALNTSQVQQSLEGIYELKGIVPRWILPIKITNNQDKNRSYQAIGLVLDSYQERIIGVGRNLDVKDLKKDECWISENVGRLLNITDSKIVVNVDVFQVLTDSGAVAKGGSTVRETSAIDSLILETLTPNIFRTNQSNSSTISDILRNSTGQDGNINPETANSLLLAAGIIAAPLPASVYENMKEQGIDRADQRYNNTVSSNAFNQTILNISHEASNITRVFTVVESIKSPKGKWQSELGNVVVIDSKYVLDIFAENFIVTARNTSIKTGNETEDILLTAYVNSQEFEDSVYTFFRSKDINDYALTLNIVLNNKEDVYANENDVRPNLISITNKMYAALGLNYPASISAPLTSILTGLFLFKNFLDIIFNATVFTLAVLSILLIYSLMISNIEEKTYEFGMLRALGLRQSNLITLLIIQGLFFAIPGLLLGLILAYALNALLSFFIYKLATLSNSYDLPSSAIILAVVLATVIPLLSNIIPIQRALSKTLRDSLNIYHRVISDITVKIMKLSKQGISASQMVGAIMLVVVGFLSYYIAPYAFVYENLALFLFILNVILMLMILGFALLTNLAQPFLEKVILRIIILFACKDRSLHCVILKNLDAHRKRNMKTSLMFSIAIAFLIFAGTGFKLLATLLTDQIKSTSGSDIVVRQAFYDKYLPEYVIRSAIDQFELDFPNVVQDYAFVSIPFDSLPQMSSVTLSTLAGSPRNRIILQSVDRNYLNSTYLEYYLPEEYDDSITYPVLIGSDKRDGIAGLYNDDGLTIISSFDLYNVTTNDNYRSDIKLNDFIGMTEITLVIPSGLAELISTHVDTPALMITTSTKFRVKIRHTAKKMPGFAFSGNKPSGAVPVLISHDDFQYMRDLIYDRLQQDAQIKQELDNYYGAIPANSSYNIPKITLQVKVYPDTPREDRLRLLNVIQSLLDGDAFLTLDITGTIETLNDTLFFIDIFFIAVSIISICLSFFFTVVSFVSNIKENSWEFGVLRAVGLTKTQMSKVYIYEALSIIIAAGILGTAVGLLVAIIVTYQFGLFTELPFKLLFPTVIFVITIVLSILTAIFGSKKAINEIKDKQIAAIIKGLD